MQFLQVTLGRYTTDNVPMLLNINNIVSIVPSQDDRSRSVVTLLSGTINVMEPFDFLKDALYNVLSESKWVEPEPVVVTEEPEDDDKANKAKKNKESGKEQPVE